MASVREKYFYARGRRKEAVARVRLYGSLRSSGIKQGPAGELQSAMVNGKKAGEYFHPSSLANKLMDPFKALGIKNDFRIEIKAAGGGMNAQAEAARLGIARALVLFNPEFKSTLRKFRLLTRDPRAKERKKYGLKGARRAPQYSKR